MNKNDDLFFDVILFFIVPVIFLGILIVFSIHLYKKDICDIPIRNLTYNEMIQAEKECKR